MPNRSAKSHDSVQVFIIYQSHEVAVAFALKQLICHWGYRAYYCRQEKRDIEIYRRELREKLVSAPMAIVLLSRELYWSAYCHAEIGTAAALQKSILALIIPPVTQEEANSISPVLEGYWMENTSEWIAESEGGVADSRQDLTGGDPFSRLKDRIRDKVGMPVQHTGGDKSVAETVLIDSVKKQLSIVIQKYSDMPQKASVRVWPRPALQKGEPACKSIIKNIQRALLDKKPITQLAFVGVSLKYSLDLITEALEKFAVEGRRDATAPSKKLAIKLVHMDDQAHFLHAIEDYAHDIKAIRSNFHEKWEVTKRDWRKSCQLASIEMLEPEVHVIDYIPPRVGILVDYGDGDFGRDCVFYAGRCAFNEPGNGFRLWIGELEYLFFTNEDHEGRVAIEEFKCFLKVYAAKEYSSGIVAMHDSGAWVARLEGYLRHYPNIRTMTVISISAHRCEPLIIAALARGINVKIYVQDAKCAPEDFKRDITSLGSRICRSSLATISSPLGVASVFYYKLPSTFRAVLIDDACLGVQMYVRPRSAQGVAEFTVGGPLPLIIPSNSFRFDPVKSKIVDLFLKASGVEAEPAYRIENGRICPVAKDDGEGN